MSRRILVCTVGTTPQVVTETLYCLQREGWAPDAVEVITTGGGLERFQRDWPRFVEALDALSLCAPTPFSFFALGRGRTLEPVVWTGDPTHAPIWPHTRNARRDIETSADVEGFGDLIRERIWAHVADDDVELHLSISGGRKTMAAHALLVLSLLGRPQDQVSHVLVSSNFEDNRRFRHPRQRGGPINTASELRRGGNMPVPTLDPADAELLLVRAPIPYVSEMKVNRLKLGALRFATLSKQLELVRQFRLTPQLTFDVDNAHHCLWRREGVDGEALCHIANSGARHEGAVARCRSGRARRKRMGDFAIALQFAGQPAGPLRARDR